MSTGGTRRPDADDWADGGRRARPRYLTLMAPSPPAPNGHQRGVRRSLFGVRDRHYPVRTPHATRLAPKVLAAMLVLGASAGLAWLLWRLAVAGAGG